MRRNKQTISVAGHATDLFTQWSVDYIKSQQKNDKPFFLYLAYNAPHFPVQPPKKYLDKVLSREKKIDSTRAKLVAFIEHMDKGIGDVLKALEDTNQLNNTLIIFTSDNGPATAGGVNRDFFDDSGPLRGIKRNLYEGGTRVPFVAHWEGVIEPGRRSAHLGAHYDLMATACGIEARDDARDPFA